MTKERVSSSAGTAAPAAHGSVRRTQVREVFLSRVSADFRPADAEIRKDFRAAINLLGVRSQGDFEETQAAYGTLSALLEELRSADAMLHYLGNNLGAVAGKRRVDTFLNQHPAIRSWAKKHRIPVYKKTYTQWESYLALYLNDVERSDKPIGIACYDICYEGDALNPEVHKHWNLLRRLGNPATSIRLLAAARGDAGYFAGRLVREARLSKIAFPPGDEPVLSDDHEDSIHGLVLNLLDLGVVNCAELALLAIPVCRKVISLDADSSDPRNFTARLVRLLGREIDDRLPIVAAFLYALWRQVQVRRPDVAPQIREVLTSVLLAANRSESAARMACSIAFPGTFPHYPLALCVEVFVARVSARHYQVCVSFRVGLQRQMLELRTRDRPTGDIVGLPGEAVPLALKHTVDAAYRLGGLDRLELMFDNNVLQSDADWREIAAQDWNALVDEDRRECVVLRWPHDSRSAQNLVRAAPDSTIETAAGDGAPGIRVFAQHGFDLPLSEWKRSIERATLTLWLRDEGTFPQQLRATGWADAYRAIRSHRWHHLGVALNPPEAPVYPRPDDITRQNLPGTLIGLGS